MPRPGFKLLILVVGGILAFAVLKGRSAMTDSAATNKAKGVVKEVVGAVRQKVGEAVGDDELQVEGAAQIVEGKVQRKVGEAQEFISDLKDRITN